jgi:hypothetical protein
LLPALLEKEKNNASTDGNDTNSQQDIENTKTRLHLLTLHFLLSALTILTLLVNRLAQTLYRLARLKSIQINKAPGMVHTNHLTPLYNIMQSGAKSACHPGHAAAKQYTIAFRQRQIAYQPRGNIIAIT